VDSVYSESEDEMEEKKRLSEKKIKKEIVG